VTASFDELDFEYATSVAEEAIRSMADLIINTSKFTVHELRDFIKERFRSEGGGRRTCQAGFKAAFAPDEEQGARIAYEKWPNAGVPGELSQVLPSPRHFEQASQLVTKDQIKDSFVCGSEAGPQLEMIGKYADAGYDEVYVANVGPNYRELIDLYAKEVIPNVR